MLSTVERVNFFQAPEGYFTGFSVKMMELVNLDVKKKRALQELKSLDHQTQMAVPEGYFSSFSDSLLKKIQADELKQAAPLLSSLPKVNNIQAPAGYFDSFSQQMLQRVSDSPVKTQSLSGNWMNVLNRMAEMIAGAIFSPKYAYALAGTASMIVIGAMLMFQVQNTTCAENDLMCQLEQVSNEELNLYFENHADEFGNSLLDKSLNEEQWIEQADRTSPSFNDLTDEDIESAILD